MSRLGRLPAFVALLALAAFLGACALPPYNEDLSLSLITKSKMERVNSIGPIYTWLDEQTRETDFYFLPDRNTPDGSDGSGGFLVNTASYGLRVWYLADSSSYLDNWWETAIDNADDTANNYLLQPIKTAAGKHYLDLLRYKQNDSYQIWTDDLYPGSIYASDPPTPLSTYFGETPVVGSSIFPDDAAASNLQYFLCWSSPSGPWVEVECTVTESGPTIVSGGLSFDLAEADGLRSVFYGRYHDSDPAKDQGYLSFWSEADRRYKSYSWSSLTSPADPGELADIKGRIDAVLTSGELLSFEDGACTVYDSSGTKLYRFPLGGLRFCYERYDTEAGEFKLYFSLTYLVYENDGGQDRLYVEVYAIPTANLADLD